MESHIHKSTCLKFKCPLYPFLKYLQQNIPTHVERIKHYLVHFCTYIYLYIHASLDLYSLPTPYPYIQMYFQIYLPKNTPLLFVKNFFLIILQNKTWKKIEVSCGLDIPDLLPDAFSDWANQKIRTWKLLRMQEMLKKKHLLQNVRVGQK